MYENGKYKIYFRSPINQKNLRHYFMYYYLCANDAINTPNCINNHACLVITLYLQNLSIQY